MVFVRDMVIGRRYMVNGIIRVLENKRVTGIIQPHGEPYYQLKFSDDPRIYNKMWDETYEEIVAGKRINRKTRKNKNKKYKKSLKIKS
jgi:hypothetical protein